jgi:hypothetical protein
MKIKIPELNVRSTGFANLFDVDNHIRKILSPVVNQINRGKADEGELAEVIQVYDLESKLPEVKDSDDLDYNLLGAIKFRKVYSQQWVSDDSLSVAYPLNLNLVDFPVKGEIVFIQKIYNRFYYTDRVNQYNSPNNSSAVGSSQKFKIGGGEKNQQTLNTAESGITKDTSVEDDGYLGNYFQPNFNIRPLIPNEGDTLLQGRFGNTIRLGSVENSPTIKLRAGQLADYEKFDEGVEFVSELEQKPLSTPLAEDINFDASSLWMTTDETVSITPATLEDTNIYPTEVAPAEFGGKQIILNSGRLIFNSKEDGILGFSNGPVDFSTLNTFGVSAKQGLNLYSPLIDIGRKNQTKNIGLSSNQVVIDATDGNITNIANKINLFGPELRDTSPAVRGTELRELLEVIIDVLGATTQAVQQIGSILSTAGAPTPNPALAKITTDMLETFSKRIEAKLNIPTLLSQVVEIE